MPSNPDYTPMLRMVNGPTPGRLIPLDRKVTVIGRLPDCHILLKPKYISKKHATIARTPDGFILTDHSYAGTFVQGQRLTSPVKLVEGMVFQVCDFAFEFHTRWVTIRDQDETDSTIFAALDASTAPPSAIRPEQKLRAVMDISRDLGRTLELGEILDNTLAALFQIFPATKRGFVLLQSGADQTLMPRAIRNRSGRDEELAISRTILNRVLEGGQAILSRDAKVDFPTSESVTDRRLRSLMCAPLLDVKRRPIGVIQLDIPEGGGKFDQEDLDLLMAVASQVSIAVEHARLHEQVLKQKELEQELLYSRQVLQALLPEGRHELGGYPFWQFYEPARFVGGDYYGWFPLPRPDDPTGGQQRRWALAVGDVAGKGMPAALMMSKLSAEVRVVLQSETEAAAAVHRLNRLLCETGIPELFVTFLLVVVDTLEHWVTVVNAGHPGLWVRRAAGRVEALNAPVLSLPLGVELDETFRAVSTTLEPGDTVVMFTDGVIEALDIAGQPLGLERLKQALLAAPSQPAVAGEALVQTVRHHAGARTQSDDLTILCIGRPGGEVAP